ncbi:MAG: hypothetical protein AAF657_03555 [Acidobacteriota bacterium]
MIELPLLLLALLLLITWPDNRGQRLTPAFESEGLIDDAYRAEASGEKVE